MGNYPSISCFSCFTNYSPPPNPPTSPYLLDSQGNSHHRHHQHANNAFTTAAEVMLEAPGYIVSSADDMRRTGHITAMKADDVLLAGKVYLVVPVRRIHCKVSEREMEIIAGLALEEKVRERKGFGGGGKSSSRISPAVVVQEDEENMVRNEETLRWDDNGGGGGGVGCCSQQRIRDGNNRRRWSPVLKPIWE